MVKSCPAKKSKIVGLGRVYPFLRKTSKNLLIFIYFPLDISPLDLFIIIKLQTVHPHSVPVLDSFFFQVFQDSRILEEFLEKFKSLLRIQIGVAKHFLNSRALHHVGPVVRAGYSIGKVLVSGVLNLKFLLKNNGRCVNRS